MTDTTTIEITQAQKESLDELKEHSRESYKSVLEKLVASWQGEKELEREQTIDVEDARILSQHVEKAIAPYFEELDTETRHTVQLEATEYSKIAEEVTHKLEGLQR
jgi:leucyl aminopeptidase (aminopeptidase T)